MRNLGIYHTTALRPQTNGELRVRGKISKMELSGFELNWTF